MSEIKNVKNQIVDLFGSKVFGLPTMRQRLPKDVYEKVVKTIQEASTLDPNVADVVATALKDWAIEHGVTHFTHWFQPMTGITAEKHDSFISATDDGKVIQEFAGKQLIQGEPDASSFPSGGLRETFEARGYTAWDPTSFAFIKGTTLYIPTTFISYTGHVLDKKTPLLRSMDAINNEAIRLLKLFGKDVKKVTTTVGAEQEYFIIPKAAYIKRKDLILAGRTLYGATPSKGQELDDHYFGRIRSGVLSYMEEVDRKLWELGVTIKTRHNEVAPCQHEIAPIFATSNVATDQNQLVMEILTTTAEKHNFACLLHEKPFKGLNGSGKHNNWSISTDTGENLLNPGDNPADNLQFLAFLVAIIEAVDTYPELLRATVTSAGNDHRLGAQEAPPAILSIFLGTQLTAALKALETGKPIDDVKDLVMDLGVEAIPNFIADVTDRNRTSPFAFTGNKFEFRMLGSKQSISGPNIALNTMVASILGRFADSLEKVPAAKFKAELVTLLQASLAEHKRVVFNGNGYADEWQVEAAKRGLPNLKNTPDAYSEYASDKNKALFEKYSIYTPTEVDARLDIHLEEYAKTVTIEAKTALSMAKRDILPAVFAYTKELTTIVAKKQEIEITAAAEKAILEKISVLSATALTEIDALDKTLADVATISCLVKAAKFYRDAVIPAQLALRATVDELETIVGAEFWPLPTYEDLLFFV
jgi:Uncharacterized protein related to glutamine synthetase